MSGNINEYLSILEIDKNEILTIAKKIEEKRRKYEEVIKKLSNQMNIRREEVIRLNNEIVPVRLGDLLDEISWLSGVNVDDISTLMKFSITFSSVEEFFQLVDNVRDKDISYPIKNVVFEIFSNINASIGVSFDYFVFLYFDLVDIQSDGKKLLEHCEFNITVCSNGDLKVEFLINKDIMDIICNFSLNTLHSNNNTSWYPADLFKVALINCAQRSYNSKVDKIRERVRTIN